MSDSQLKKRKLAGKRLQVKRPTEKREMKMAKNLTKHFWKFFVYSAFASPFVAVAVLVLMESPIKAQEYNLPGPMEWTGPLTPNSRLTEAELLFHNEIIGPESLMVDGENGIITGTYDGRIIQIKNGAVIHEVRLGKGPCGTFDTEPTCGRPLGIRWSSSKKKTLIVADAYLGLYDVDLVSGEFQQLIPGGLVVDGRPLTFLNDVVVLQNGTILFTDSSSKWDRRKFIFNLLEFSDDGRLLSYCPETKKIRVLLDGLHFANGIQTDKEENYVLINELAKARILKYHLKGSRVGVFDVFLDNMPGFPDNIRMSHNGTYWVGLAFVRRREKFSFADALGPYPMIRNMLAKIIPMKHIIPLLHTFSPSYGLIVQVDTNGKYVSSLHDPTGKRVPSVSEIDDDGKSLYMGSYHSKFIAKVDL